MAGEEATRVPIKPELGELEAEAERRIRQIVREEIASMSGLILRRIEEMELPGAGAGDLPISYSEIASLFGETLRDFGGTATEPGS